MTTFQFTALGIPSPQGSMRPVPTKQGLRVITATTPALRLWRSIVAAEARAARGDQLPIEGPVRVHANFVMPRPKSARKADRWHTKRPDIDKLTRALLDSLTDAGVFADDAQVGQLMVQKTLADRTDPWTGVIVMVDSVPDSWIVYQEDIA